MASDLKGKHIYPSFIDLFSDYGMPEIKKQLWGGEFWSKGYFVSTVGRNGNEAKTASYVKNQGKSGNGYKVMHKVKQLSLLSYEDFG